MSAVLYPAALAFVTALLTGPATIAFLHRLRLGQSIRADGPREHLKKAGTPTMGGVLIVLGATAATLAFAPGFSMVLYALFAFLGYALIGLVDDFIIVASKRSLGLRARYKLVGQTVIALTLALFAVNAPELGPRVLVPFTGGELVLAPWLYVLLAVAAVVGAANAVNLTDGLDGLAAGSGAVASFALAVLALRLGSVEVAVFAGAVGGAALGFAWFNAHPAQVFMGDTGSLALGAALAAAAVLTRTPLFLLLVGGLFIIETLSVILQVLYFRLTGGRRIFRMSPLHHHFELSGWAEPKVVTRFWLVAIVFALLGVAALP